ncbi:uncharacterized protein METZ01_LOCUS202262 [marine metagenome]|uniref:Uncharacterized protein n=1 Tax=marine metagenome TaxID=408172 RepID=A0A382EFB4_9ZZZZ
MFNVLATIDGKPNDPTIAAQPDRRNILKVKGNIIFKQRGMSSCIYFK